MTTNDKPYIAALDVGSKRIGVALAHYQAGLPSPHSTLVHDETVWGRLRQLIDDEAVGELVVGLPRGLDGQETAQTASVRAFVVELQKHIDLPIHWQDEALTSVQAEAMLRQQQPGYNKDLVDAYAAAIILEDYVRNRKESDETTR